MRRILGPAQMLDNIIELPRNGQAPVWNAATPARRARVVAMQASERRIQSRVRTAGTVSMRIIDPPSAASSAVRLRDISKDGIRLLAPEALDAGSLILVKLKETRILAIVRHCSPAAGNESEDRFRLGAEIQHVYESRLSEPPFTATEPRCPRPA